MVAFKNTELRMTKWLELFLTTVRIDLHSVVRKHGAKARQTADNFWLPSSPRGGYTIAMFTDLWYNEAKKGGIALWI
jgi:hypothetical protein